MRQDVKQRVRQAVKLTVSLNAKLPVKLAGSQLVAKRNASLGVSGVVRQRARLDASHHVKRVVRRRAK